MANEYTVERIVAEVDASTGDFEREITKAERRLDRFTRDRTADIDVDVDDGDIKKGEAKLSHLSRDRTANIKADVDKNSLKSAGAQFTKFQKEALTFKRAGQGTGLLTGFIGIPAALEAVGPALSAVNALGAGTIALGGAVRTMSGAFAAAPAGITSLIAGFGTLKLATAGVGDAFKEYQKLLADKKPAEALLEVAKATKGSLSPAALNAVQNMSSLYDLVKQIGVSLQVPIFNAFNAQVGNLGKLIQSLGPSLRTLAGSLGSAFNQVGSFLGQTDVQGRIGNIVGDAAPQFAALGRVITNVADAFLRVAEAGGPVMTRLANSAVILSEKFRQFIQTSTESGRLVDVMNRGIDATVSFGRSVGNLGKALNSMFSAGTEGGNDMLAGLERLTAQFASFMGSTRTQNAIKQMMDDAKPVLREVGLLFKDLAVAMVNLGKDGSQPLVDITRALRTQLLPALVSVIEAAAESGVIEALVGAFSELLNVLATFKGASQIFVTIIDSVQQLASAFNTLVGAVPMLGSLLANLATSFGLLKIIGVKSPIVMGVMSIASVLTTLTGNAKAATPVITAFVAAWGAFKVVGLIQNMQQLATTMQLFAAGRGTVSVSAIKEMTAASAQLGMSAAQTKKFSTSLLSVQAGMQGVGGAATGASGGVRGLTAALGLGGGAGLSLASTGVGIAIAAAAAGLMTWQSNVAKAEEDTKAMTEALAELETASGNLVDPLASARTEFGSWIESNEMTDDLRASNVNLKDLYENINRYSFALEENGGQLRVVNKYHDNMAYTLDDAQNALGDNYRALVDYNGMADTTAKNVGHWADKMKDAYNQQIDTWISTQKLTQAQVDAALSANTAADGTVDLNGVMEDLTGQLGEAATEFDRLKASQGATNILMTQFAQAATMAERSASLLGDALNKNFGSDIDRLVSQAQLIDGYKQLGEAIKAAEDKSVAGLTTNLQVLQQFGAMRQGGIEFARAMVQSGQSVEDASRFLKDMFLPAMNNAMREAGLGDDVIQQLNQTLGLTPEKVDISLQVYGAELGKLKLEDLYQQAKDITNEQYRADIEVLLSQGRFDEAKQMIDSWVGENRMVTVPVVGDLGAWTPQIDSVLKDIISVDDQEGTVSILADPSVWTETQRRVVLESGILDQLQSDPKIQANDQATRAINDIRTRLTTLANTRWTVSITGDTSSISRAVDNARSQLATIAAQARAAAQSGEADGSVRLYKMASGGMLPRNAVIKYPQGRGLVQWAEPETRGEAFIPLARSKRRRSLSIWMETGRRLGVDERLVNGIASVTPMQQGGFFNPYLGRGGYQLLSGLMPQKFQLGAGGDYGTDANVRLFSQGVLQFIRGMGAIVKQVDFDRFDIDTSRVADKLRVAQILDNLSATGWSLGDVSEPQFTPQRQEPYVVINNPVFKDEADIDMLNRKIEWAIRTERFSPT